MNFGLNFFNLKEKRIKMNVFLVDLLTNMYLLWHNLACVPEKCGWGWFERER